MKGERISNTKNSYGWISIVLHWLAAMGVIAMIATGIRAGVLQQTGDREASSMLMRLHVSVGATLFFLFAVRIAFHYAQIQPEKLNRARWLNIVAGLIQNLLLLGLAIQIISGPLIVWSEAHAISLFNFVSLPSPFSAINNSVHETAKIAHVVGRILILAAIPIHILGACRQFADRRLETRWRMLQPRRATNC